MLDTNFVQHDVPSSPEQVLDAYSRTVAGVVDRAGPAVVRVESGAGQRAGIGSGVVIAGDGLILTNSHVVAGANSVRLGFSSGAQAEAKRCRR